MQECINAGAAIIADAAPEVFLMNDLRERFFILGFRFKKRR
jgi:hypothetical protein